MSQVALDSAISLVAKNLRNDEFFVKFVELIDYVVNEYKLGIADVKYKNQDPTMLREEAIKQIVTELGFDYLRKLMDTLSNIEFNVLVDFISLLNLLKGNREGLAIVLRLIGLDSIIVEWWESSPPKEEMTFDLTVIVTSSIVPDIDDTIAKLRVFLRHYVIPKLDIIEYKFVLGAFLEQYIGVGGFTRYKTFGRISARI